MEKLNETRALTFVTMRANLEAATLKTPLHPEHLFLALLKLAEITADDITPNSRYREQTNADIKQVADTLAHAAIDTRKTREQLRRILSTEKPAGDGATLVKTLINHVCTQANGDTLTAALLLTQILREPTPILKAILPSPETGGNTPTPDPRTHGLPFLTHLTERIRHMRYTLLAKIHGQDHAVHAFAEGIFNAEILADADEKRNRPRATFIFAGPPGVGKTFLAEQAAETLDIPFKRFDMSAFADHQAHSNLIGFNASYKDAKPGSLTGFVRQTPHSILLFDEIEKAHLNTIQLFLQILDAGTLHDDFLDENITFRHTIIIFTTNAGRQLYEDDLKSPPAALPPQTILDALETDTHPQTLQPYFPAAIRSRMATGYPVMFNHLRTHHLQHICLAEFQRLSRLFQKQYNLKITADRLLPSVLLFAEGGHADARSICTRTELFFKNELFKLFLLWETELQTALEQLHSLHFKIETDDMPDNVTPLFDNTERREILLFGNADNALRLREALPRLEIHHADNTPGAMKLLHENDIHLVLLELFPAPHPARKTPPATIPVRNDAPQDYAPTITAFNHIPPGASSLKTPRHFFKTLREHLPAMPLYLLESEKSRIDDELLATFVRAGARGKLTLPGNDRDVLAEEITSICTQAFLHNMADGLAMQHKILSFETVPTLSHDKKHAVIRLREFSLRRAVSAPDSRQVLDDMEKPATRFDDVIGATDAKNELQYFVNFLKNPKKAALSGYRPPKGVLLYGPPGTGKTMLARAMAGESDVAFIPATASNFVTKWQGSGPESVRNLFMRARRYAPAIIFIDEIDAIGRTRGKGNTGHGEEMALNALFTEMDGFALDPGRPVFVLAATNFNIEDGKDAVGAIDPALTRRFDRKILVDLPDRDNRKQYLTIMLRKRTNKITQTMIQRLAERSAGYSLANLETVLELAFRMADRKNRPADDEILEEAYELNRHGEKKDWSSDSLERVARHEAGHAYLCFLAGRTPAYLTIVARGNHGGYTEYAGSHEYAPMNTRDELLSRIRTALGGRASEIIYYGEDGGISSGAAGDLLSATRIARAMICTCGMDELIGPVALSEEEATQGPLAGKITERIAAIIQKELLRAIKIIREGKPVIDKLVNKLLEKNKLTGEEMETILKTARK